jgi:hypothetical protein
MSNIFKQPKVQTVQPKPVATMPDTQSPAVREASRVETQRSMSRAGRRSTILSSPKQNYDSYSARKTG